MLMLYQGHVYQLHRGESCRAEKLLFDDWYKVKYSFGWIFWFIEDGVLIFYVKDFTDDESDYSIEGYACVYVLIIVHGI